MDQAQVTKALRKRIASGSLRSSSSRAVDDIPRSSRLKSKSSSSAVVKCSLPPVHQSVTTSPDDGSSKLSQGTRHFHGKFIPDWMVRSSDSVLENPATGMAILQGLLLEKDKEIISDWSSENVVSTFYHDLAKVILGANWMHDNLARQTTSLMNQDERIQMFLKKLEESKLREKRLESQVSDLHSQIATKELEMQKEVSRALASYRDTEEFRAFVNEAVKAYKSSPEYFEEILLESSSQYTNGFEDCKKQLSTKKEGDWSFLRVEELDGQMHDAGTGEKSDDENMGD